MNNIDFRKAINAGLIAGVIFLILEMIMVPLFLGGSPWGPPRMMAGIVLGDRILPPPATFNLVAVVTALVLHLFLSVVYAVFLALIVNKTKFIVGLLIGAVAGYVLYLVNFYLFTNMFPWFANARNWVTVFSHISFGIGAAWAYMGLVRHQVFSTTN